jgi:hypothetical protein
MLNATSKIGIETRKAPMVGRNSPKKANTPKMSAGCTPINESNTPIERPVNNSAARADPRDAFRS